MEKIYALFNPMAGTINIEKSEKAAREAFPEANIFIQDATKIGDMKKYVSGINGAKLLLIGGDGTLNKFINSTAGLNLSNIWYLAGGSGNDFARDVGCTNKPVCIDRFLANLPTVTVKGKTYKFLNGVGYGIDGYCCETGDKLKALGKKVNYTSIAVKGLLFHYKPRNAKVCVDGREYSFKKVWIAPTMHGKYYGGGGMIPAPEQSRENDCTLSLCLLSGKGKLKTLMCFPKIFSGEHVKNKMTTILQGREITVSFDKPAALQIDGETVLGVTSYTARAAKQADAQSEAAETSTPS